MIDLDTLASQMASSSGEKAGEWKERLEDQIRRQGFNGISITHER